MDTQAAIYVRQSEDEREGIDRALGRCRNLVKAKGWTLAGEYADNYVSASKSRGAGTAWSRLLADVRAGRVNAVVGVDVDRLVRSITDLATLIDLGAKVLTVDGEIDLTTSDGEFRATMLAGIARFEVRRKAERQKRANEYRVTTLGLPVPGKRRFGFESGNVEERKVEADVVRNLYDSVLHGASIFSLAKGLGRPTVRVREILTNPAYAGWIPYQGERYEASEAVARVVDRETFEAVQAVLSAPERKTSHSNQIAYLASGTARCGVCAARMVKQGPGYLCKGNLSHPYITREILDDVLKWEALEYLLGLESAAEPEELRRAWPRLPNSSASGVCCRTWLLGRVLTQLRCANSFPRWDARLRRRTGCSPASERRAWPVMRWTGCGLRLSASRMT